MRNPLVSLVVAMLASPLSAQLAGVYSINPAWPASPGNFPSLGAATAALVAQGVAGPVSMQLYDDAGPFTEANPFTSTSGPFAPQTAVLSLTQWPGASTANRVTFEPAPGESPVFDATGRAMGVFWGGADYVTLRGIEIANAIFDAVSLYSEASHGVATDPVIDSCRLHDCGGTGVTIYGNTPNPLNTLVVSCTMWRLQLTNAGSFNTTGRFGYVTTRRSMNTRIVHNTFIMDAGTGSLLSVLGAYPSSTSEVPFAEVTGNLFVKSVGSTAPIFLMNTPTGTTNPVPTVCEANAFHDTSGGPFARLGASSPATVATLLDWQTNQLCDLTSIAGDPLFRGAATRDYHLTASSPCRDASSIGTIAGVDADGQPRLGPEDLGADEYSAAAATPVGAGCVGSTGLTATLRGNEPFLGNPAFALTVERAPAGALTYLFGALATAPFGLPFGGGCSIWLDLSSLVGLAPAFAGPAGSASCTFALPANVAFVGLHLGYQTLVLDAAAPVGLTFSNAIDAGFDF